MRRCETCGATLEEGLCPTCLLGDALTATGDTTPPDSQHGSPVANWLETAARLRESRDFFQRYNILEQIGQGGQGDVLKVWDFTFRRVVAMKRPGESALTSEPALYRFLAEAQITAQLEHPGILPVFDVGLDPDGRPYYTTQLLPGRTLEHVWREIHEAKATAPATNHALELLLRVCDVMAHAHHRGVIHRDLKPANVLVGAYGEVRIIDWGSAHVLESAKRDFETPLVPLNQPVIQTERGEVVWGDPTSPLLTANAGLPMTVLFTPPEILEGKIGALGPQTDIYSMGVMLYGLLAGRPPYSDAAGKLPAAPALKQLILDQPPVPLRHLELPVSRDLAAVCEKAMARSQTERYISMTELADDLRAVLTIHPVKARKPGPLLVFQKWAQRNSAYVTVAGVSLVIVTLAVAFAHARRVERDATRQINALRTAELAARSGQWHEVLRSLDVAESAGYGDWVDLELQRAEAWTVLSDPGQSQRILVRLARRSNLGARRGLVLLRLGEHELFDPPTARQGAQRIQTALAEGLAKADAAFARGLLAESTPEAIRHFQEAIRFNPYHHGAHRHALGLEFLLGRRADLSNHVAVFKILYPEDPSPVNLEAAELALQGHLSEAKTHLATLRGRVNSNALESLERACESYAAMATSFRVETVIASKSQPRSNRDLLLTGPMGPGLALLPGGSANGPEQPHQLRIPQLPSLRQGILEGSDALARLAIPFLGDPTLATRTIRSSCQHHPEALVPILAGLLLENQRAPSETNIAPVLRLQSELYQLASELPSLVPNLGRLADYLATQASFELAGLKDDHASTARATCLLNLRRVVERPLSTVEAEAYFEFALRLGAGDVARAVLARWEQQPPGSPAFSRARIRLELAAGALGPALELIEARLAGKPDDAWALEQRRIAWQSIRALQKSVPPVAP